MRGWAVPAVAGLLGVVATLGLRGCPDARITTSRLSPDERYLARLVEVSPRFHLDRNVELRLEDRSTGRVVSLMPGLDGQGRPEGSERLIWSRDGAWLLLVGRHFYVRDDLFLDNGDQLYFLHHLPTGRSWINADLRSPTVAPLGAGQVEGIEFTEPVVLEAR